MTTQTKPATPLSNSITWDEQRRRAEAYPELVAALRGTVQAADAFAQEHPTAGESACITVTRALLARLEGDK